MKVGDDALQRRIARLIAPDGAPKSIRSGVGACVGTSLGNVREQNQDRALVVSATYATAPERNFVLGVLSDGMGGLLHGSEAAVVALSVFASRVLRTPKLPSSERLRSATLAANDAVYRTFGGRSGTTISAVFVNGDGPLLGVNVGDSRIYGITSAREAIQLSRDDTLAGFLGEEGQGGENQHRLVQFLGMGEGIEPNIISAHRKDVASLLLTSDGVHGSMPDVVASVVRVASSGSDVVRKLLTISEALGGRDNGTVVALPSKLEAQKSDGEQGLNLTLMSASDRLEIWIPILVEDARQERMPTALTDASDVNIHGPAMLGRSGEISGSHEAAGASPERGRRVGRKRRAANRPKRSDSVANKKRESQEERLPIDEDSQPTLDIKFPQSS